MFAECQDPIGRSVFRATIADIAGLTVLNYRTTLSMLHKLRDVELLRIDRTTEDTGRYPIDGSTYTMIRSL
jgi:hypothetical protein